MMIARVLCLLAEGFEEIEVVTPIDILRRAGVEVVVAGVGESRQMTGRSGIAIPTDLPLDAVDAEGFDLLLLPGGPAVAALRQDGRAACLARAFDEAGKRVAAICAAPLILKDAGLLNGRAFTAHFSTRDELPDALDARVVTDGRLTTSRGAGTALDFALAMARDLAGPDAADAVAAAIMA